MGTTSNAYVPFQISGRWVLVSAGLVREVLGRQSTLPLPGARPELPGAVAWRGQAIPVVDIAPILEMAASPYGQRPRTLIVSLERSVAALPVDDAREVRSISSDAMQAVHAEPIPYAIAETQTDSGLMSVLDIALLLSELADRQGAQLG